MNPIIDADSLKIKFYCDEDGDGLVDSLEIRIGEPAENSQNPSDYKLILVKNSNEQTIATYGVTKFKFDYLDIMVFQLMKIIYKIHHCFFEN